LKLSSRSEAFLRQENLQLRVDLIPSGAVGNDDCDRRAGLGGGENQVVGAGADYLGYLAVKNKDLRRYFDAITVRGASDFVDRWD
jgi:hypothetical protein